MVFAGKSLHVRLALPFQTGLLEADPEGIRRIVTALLDNAKKYTPADGTIAISLLDDSKALSWRSPILVVEFRRSRLHESSIVSTELIHPATSKPAVVAWD
jgi:signal transduction histidine kinase